MLQALADHRLGPDLLVGASAGALNAAYVAGHGFTHDTLDRLADVWRGLRRHEVFPFAPHRQFLALLGARPSLCAADGLHRLVRDNLTYDRLEQATIPIQIIATDVISGTEVALVHGDPVPAVLASAAIPAVFPTVTIEGQVLFDGGVADNTPISQAVAAGADRVVVLPAGVACALPHPPRSALAVAVHALTLLIEQRLMLDVAAYHDQVDLVVLPPLCPLTIAASDFRHAASLIDRARSATTRWLDAGNHQLPHPERFLALHRHPAPVAAVTRPHVRMQHAPSAHRPALPTASRTSTFRRSR